MVQYAFDGPEVDVKSKLHGNLKSDKPFVRTSASTKKRISELASSSTPKAVVATVTKEKGGEIEVRGMASLPRDRRQVSYVRQKN